MRITHLIFTISALLMLSGCGNDNGAPDWWPAEFEYDADRVSPADRDYSFFPDPAESKERTLAQIMSNKEYMQFAQYAVKTINCLEHKDAECFKEQTSVTDSEWEQLENHFYTPPDEGRGFSLEDGLSITWITDDIGDGKVRFKEGSADDIIRKDGRLEFKITRLDNDELDIKLVDYW